jgi:hypothetical protein
MADFSQFFPIGRGTEFPKLGGLMLMMDGLGDQFQTDNMTFQRAGTVETDSTKYDPAIQRDGVVTTSVYNASTIEYDNSMNGSIASGIGTDGSGTFVIGNKFLNTTSSPRLLVTTDWVDFTAVTIPTTFDEIYVVKYLNGLWLAGGGNQDSTASDDIVATASNPLGPWTIRSTGAGSGSISNGRVTDFAYGNGKYVATGVLNHHLTSTDGVTWAVGSASGPDYQSIVFGNGVFVKAYYSNQVTTTAAIGVSADAVTWTSYSVGNGGRLYFIEGYFYQLGAGGLRRSSDGINWTTVLTLNYPSQSPRDFAFGYDPVSGRYYVVVYSTTTIAYASYDPANWTNMSSLTFEMGVSSNLGVLYVHGEFLYSHWYQTLRKQRLGLYAGVPSNAGTTHTASDYFVRIK